MSSLPRIFLLFSLCFSLFPSFFSLSHPDPLTIRPFQVNHSSPATIPAFPEQSDVQGCRLDLPDDLFHGIKTACGPSKGGVSGNLHRSRCCPVLAAWLYAAYSATALRRPVRVSAAPGHTAPSYDLPLLPDDSETCVSNLDQALNQKGIELMKPNETCDVVYCYCGIRLHPLSCPEAFSLTHDGILEGDGNVKRLERNCLSSSNANGFPGLGGCSKCLSTLYQLNNKEALNSSKPENRTIKMHHKECQLMGLTWLLAKNRTAYIHTVTSVLRAKMMSKDGSDPRSCTLNSDGMPLAVNSTEISGSSVSVPIQAPLKLGLVWLALMFNLFMLGSTQ
ncbi:uncharacterized GPI-anchored protein At4g28100-like [Cucurbita moschata]|uniref:Uncharacterized GPI-anchored protein At4g28100-like n=1 Tax=Cucurbita moschata TaxID=3662 RepID=A0A6J1E361_CUCMO|nr:uncharacterized GPI-anchored protein At4g28100-like [Cucurbita moschata]